TFKGQDGKEYSMQVDFICSRTTSTDGSLQSNICERSRAIRKAIDQYANTYPRRQIFLAGHSAGAWASLLIKRSDPSAVNGLILTAPAFDGNVTNDHVLSQIAKMKMMQAVECNDGPNMTGS
ncbi:unnamed protein product, partial [marine sediment metagenome]